MKPERPQAHSTNSSGIRPKKTKKGTQILYNLFFPLVFAVLLPGFFIRMLRRGNYQHQFGQRFAFYSPRVRSRLASRSWTWVHAVSVGEVLIALKLIRRMKAEEPTRDFLLSTTTSTGFALATQEQDLEVIYHPLDFFWTVRRAIRLIRPKQLILVEAEVWPNLVWEAKRVGASVALVNARLSPRSEKRFRTFRWIVSPLFQILDAICLQEPEDILRWKRLGARENQLYLIGSIKFDDAEDNHRPARDFQPLLHALGCPPNAPVLLGGSTHAGEEKILAKAYLSIRKTLPSTFLLLAPRHVERSAEILEELRQCGLNPILRSAERATSPNVDCIVIDSTGELKDWYRCADAVFIGKSLTAKGGQNPAEAIAAGKPLTFGPHMQNFSDLTRALLSVNGAVVSHNAKELEENLRRMLAEPLWAQSLCKNATDCMAAHRKATHRTSQILRNF